MLAVLALTLPCSPASTAEHKIVYLGHTWSRKADDLNFFTTADRHRVAVDDDGMHVASSPLDHADRTIKLAFDSLFVHDGQYFIGRNLGNHGYDYISIGTRKTLSGGADLRAKPLWEKTLFRIDGHHFDPDPIRGDIGMAIFPAAKLAIWCGQSQWDSRGFGVSAFGEDKHRPQYDLKAFPLSSSAGGSVKSEDFPDRVFLDQAARGFWYLGGSGGVDARQMVVAFVTPELTARGARELKLGKQVPIGAFGTNTFEAGVIARDKLFLLIAQPVPRIGGVDPSRRLLRIDRTTGALAETRVSFNCFIDDVRLAALGDDVAIHSPDELAVVAGDSLEEKWRMSIDQMIDRGGLDYRCYRVCGSPAGDRLAVGLATPYRKPGEHTHVRILAASGKMVSEHALKPGSIDNLVFTKDGGLLVLSGQYTATIGGATDVLANEAEATARARTRAPQQGLATGPATRPHSYRAGPLKDRHTIWFNQPARGFGGESLPLGNGHLGAMFDGRTDASRIVVNVDSMWEGSESDMAAYQGFAEIGLALNHDPKEIGDYRRELDLRTGLYSVTYTHEGTRYKREAFCSYPHGLLAVRLTADKPGAYTGDIELMAMHESQFKKDRDGIEFTGALANGRKYQAVMRLQAEGGEIRPEAGAGGERVFTWRRFTSHRPYQSIRVEGADSITIYLAGDTDYSLNPADRFRGPDPAVKIAPRLATIGKLSFDQLKAASAEDVAALFDRCTIELATKNPEAESLPVDARMNAYAKGAGDTGLEALAFAAQRYTMIACSRPGSLPANLQGIWNNSNWPAWTADYHTDINIQMNYWFIEPANLPECAEPLFDYFDSQIPVWRKRAKATFGDAVRGWTVGYMNNIDGGMAYKNFPPGSAWLAWHVAQHFKFNQDQDFLTNRAYPMLKELSQQWQDILIERPDGQLTTPRTMSPEHKPMQYGIGQDTQIVHNLFTDYLAAAKRLDVDPGLRAEVADLRHRLLPIKIGRWGQIQEWERDRDSRYCTHRHIQHLFAAFPGSQISPHTPELSHAAVTSLEARGMGSAGWSHAWRISLFARLGRPDLVDRQLRSTLRALHPNLVWQGKEQIDAGCGYASGVCEALLQSHVTLDQTDSQFLIHLLPALPPSWPTGKARGLRARGGLTVDVEWEGRKVTRFTIRSATPRNVQVRVDDETRAVPTCPL